MKRLLAIVLVSVMLLSVAALTGCKKTEPTPVETTADAQTQAAQETDAAPKESAPLALSSFTAKAGDYDLTFEPVDLGFVQGGESTYEFCGEFANGKYYLSDEQSKVVYVYALDGATATLENKFELEDGYEKISVSPDGDVYLSPGIFESVILKDDGTVTKTAFKHDVEWAKDQDFAVTTWVNADPTVIKGGEESPWVFQNLNDPSKRVGNLSMVFDCEIADDRVIIAGTYADGDDDNYRMGIFDFEGNELAMTAVDDPVGYPAVGGTKNGIISANVNKLYLHDYDGKPLGSIDGLRSLAGLDDTVSTFWVKEFSPADDGSVYMLVYTSKKDDTTEALLYKVSGF